MGPMGDRRQARSHRVFGRTAGLVLGDVMSLGSVA